MVFDGLSWAGVRWAFTQSHGGHWHPLSWIAHMIDVQIFGLDPWGPHIVSAAIHTLNALLVYALFRRILSNPLVALILSCMFALHPLRIESVAWVSERKDVLALFFSLLAIHAYLWFAKRRSIIRYLPLLLLHAAALLSKPSAVVLPLLFLLLDFWPLRITQGWVWRVAEKIPLLLLSLGSSLAAIWAQNSAGALAALDTVPLDARFSTALVAWSAYFGKLLFPTRIGIFYPVVPYPPGVASGAALLLLLVSWICFRERQRRPYLLVGWLWFLIATLPIVGFVAVGGQAFADRWTYLPHIGVLLAAGAFAIEFREVFRPVWQLSFGVLLTCAYSYKTIQELPHWATSESVFRRALEAFPNNFMAHTNLGSALSDSGRWEEAAVHYEEAYRLSPNYPEAINNLGILRAHQNRLSEAAGLFQKALQIRPNFQQARNNLSLALRQSNNACGSNICQ